MHPCTSDWRATTCVLGQCSQVVWVSKIGGFIIQTRSWLYAEWCSCIIFLPDGRVRAGYDDFDIRERSFCVLLDSFRLCTIQGKERIAPCKNISAIIALRCYNGTSFGHTCKTSENEDQVVVRCCLRILWILKRYLSAITLLRQCPSFLVQYAFFVVNIFMYKKCLRIWDQTCSCGPEPWPNILTNC